MDVIEFPYLNIAYGGGDVVVQETLVETGGLGGLWPAWLVQKLLKGIRQC